MSGVQKIQADDTGQQYNHWTFNNSYVKKSVSVMVVSQDFVYPRVGPLSFDRGECKDVNPTILWTINVTHLTGPTSEFK